MDDLHVVPHHDQTVAAKTSGGVANRYGSHREIQPAPEGGAVACGFQPGLGMGVLAPSPRWGKSGQLSWSQAQNCISTGAWVLQRQLELFPTHSLTSASLAICVSAWTLRSPLAWGRGYHRCPARAASVRSPWPSPQSPPRAPIAEPARAFCLNPPPSLNLGTRSDPQSFRIFHFKNSTGHRRQPKDFL